MLCSQVMSAVSIASPVAAGPHLGSVPLEVCVRAAKAGLQTMVRCICQLKDTAVVYKPLQRQCKTGSLVAASLWCCNACLYAWRA